MGSFFMVVTLFTENATLLMSFLYFRMGKTSDLRDFECDMTVDDLCAGTEMSALLGVLNAQLPLGFIDNGMTNKKTTRGRRRMARIMEANMRATNRLITAVSIDKCSCGMIQTPFRIPALKNSARSGGNWGLAQY